MTSSVSVGHRIRVAMLLVKETLREKNEVIMGTASSEQ